MFIKLNFIIKQLEYDSPKSLFGDNTYKTCVSWNPSVNYYNIQSAVLLKLKFTMDYIQTRPGYSALAEPCMWKLLILCMVSHCQLQYLLATTLQLAEAQAPVYDVNDDARSSAANGEAALSVSSSSQVPWNTEDAKQV